MEYTKSNVCMAVMAAVAVLAAAGCDRQDSGRTVGQRVDQSATKLADKTSEAATNVAMAADDTAITAKVKASLMAEPGLKSLEINVDTKDAMVTLSGNVSSNDLRDRAKQIAASTAGVRGVIDNLLLKTTS